MCIVRTKKLHYCHLCGKEIPIHTQAKMFRVRDTVTGRLNRVYYCPLFGCYTDPKSPAVQLQLMR